MFGWVIAGFLVVSGLSSCGSDSGGDATKAISVTDTVEPEGDSAPLSTVSDVPAPTSTLYAADQPTPTALVGADCSYQDPTKIVFQNFEELRAETIECTSEFAWPSGYEIDPEKLAFSGGNSSGGEVGLARTAVSFNNACAWMTAWVDYTKAGDQEAANQALLYMEHTLPYWNNQGAPEPDNADPLFLDPISKAKLGDPTGIMQWVNGPDCAMYETFRVDP